MMKDSISMLNDDRSILGWDPMLLSPASSCALDLDLGCNANDPSSASSSLPSPPASNDCSKAKSVISDLDKYLNVVSDL